MPPATPSFLDRLIAPMMYEQEARWPDRAKSSSKAKLGTQFHAGGLGLAKEDLPLSP